MTSLYVYLYPCERERESERNSERVISRPKMTGERVIYRLKMTEERAMYSQKMTEESDSLPENG
jgi:hypothetical protein